MSIIAMRVISVQQHPNADRLKVYSFSDDVSDPIQVVANLTNVYEVGDIAAVAKVGTTLDGIEIKETRIRGTDSFGMALGKVDDLVGTDVTTRFAKDIV